VGLRSFISGRDFTAAAEALALSLARDIPPTLPLSDLNLSVSRLSNLLERRFELAAQFQLTHPMGWIRRAQYANSFRWKLLEMGYEKEFVEVATEGLVHRLARNKTRSKNQPK